MDIPFTCPECAKPYRVAETLAGKRVKCKRCGTMIAIPAAVSSPEVASGPAPEDLYGLDDPGPMPSVLPPRLAPSRGTEAAGPLVKKVKKKRKSSGPGMDVKILKIAGGVVAAIVLLVFGVPFLLREGFGIVLYSEVHNHHLSIIKDEEEVVDALASIKDPTDVGPAAERVRKALHHEIETLNIMLKLQARKADIENSLNSLADRRKAYDARAREVVGRVLAVPGAVEALRGAFSELMAFAAAHPEVVQQQGLAGAGMSGPMPNMNPPPHVPPGTFPGQGPAGFDPSRMPPPPQFPLHR